MFEEVAPTGADTPVHIHHNSDEVTYVLAGEITFKIGDHITVGGPGTCAFIPRGVPHAWKSTGAEAARALFTYAPAAAGRWFEELSELQRSVLSMDAEELARFSKRHGWEIVGPSPF